MTERLRKSISGFFFQKSFEELGKTIHLIRDRLGEEDLKKTMLKNLSAFPSCNSEEIKDILDYLEEFRGMDKEDTNRLLKKNLSAFVSMKVSALDKIIEFLEVELRIKKININIVNQMILKNFKGFKINLQSLKDIVEYFEGLDNKNGLGFKRSEVKQMIITNLEAISLINLENLKSLIESFERTYNMTETDIRFMMKKNLHIFYTTQFKNMESLATFLNEKYDISMDTIFQMMKKNLEQFKVTERNVTRMEAFLKNARDIDAGNFIQILGRNLAYFGISIRKLKDLIRFLENVRGISRDKVNQMLQNLSYWKNVNKENVTQLVHFLEKELFPEEEELNFSSIEVNQMVEENIGDFSVSSEDVKTLRESLQVHQMSKEKIKLIIKKNLEVIPTIAFFIKNTENLINDSAFYKTEQKVYTSNYPLREFISNRK